MFIKILIAVVLLFGGFLGYVAVQPSEMHIARERFIEASPEAIFPFINNSQKANEWMPWAEEDPGVKMTFSGPPEGVGSTSSWDSSGRMGTGKAEVVESLPNQSVKTKLTYSKPMNMSQIADVTLKPTAGGTIVRWEVSGNNTFVGRFFCVFINMEKVVGAQFEKGLSNLRSKVTGKQ